MFLAGMNQLAVAGTEVVKSFISDNHTKKNEDAASLQINSIDSVTLSDKAVELSSETGTEMEFEEEGSGEEDPEEGQSQEQTSTVATSINLLA